jgi:deoxyuridine 5'-triphosphate nucleotidohydrolase
MTIACGVYKVHSSAKYPTKGTTMSACYDLSACFYDDTVKIHRLREPIPVRDDKDGKGKYIMLYPDDLALIPTGLIFILPEQYHMKVYSRSGNVWKRKLIVANQPAIIDSDYTNETFVLLHNRSLDVQRIYHGDRIAQCELRRNRNVEFYFCDESDLEEAKVEIKKTSLRLGGLGSTGV